MRPTFVLLGGVPGAGKTTLLHGLRAAVPDVRTLDPERHRDRLARVLPRGLGYRWYRPLVHLVATAHLLGVLLRGAGAGALVVHDPATRPRRRALVGRVARWRGWDPVLVVLDVEREVALQGQRDRRRMVRPRSFARHWRRWTAQRPALLAAHLTGRPLDGWSRVHVVDRGGATGLLPRVLGGVRPVPVGVPVGVPAGVPAGGPGGGPVSAPAP